MVVGKHNLVVANSGSDDVSVLLGQGDGSFAATQDFPTGARPSSVVIADVNADQRLDVAVANAGSDTVTLLLGACR
jgi:hypothetical protein